MKKPYKKPKNSHGLCDAAVGINYEHGPQIIKCKNLGVWLYFDETWKSKIGVVLCDECCRKIEKKNHAK